MKTAKRLLTIVVAVELVVGAALSVRRLNSTQPVPPPVDQNTDSITARELLALPEKYLFDSSAKWSTLGENYMAYGFFAKAGACFGQAFQSDPGSPLAAFNHGYCLERLGHLDQAHEVFSRMTQGKSRHFRQMAWYRLGRISLQREQPEKARQAFEQAGDDHMPGVYQRVKLMVRGGQSVSAEPLLELLVEAHSHDIRVWQLCARVFADLGRTEEAGAAYDSVERARAEMEPDDMAQHSQPIREGLGLSRIVAQAFQAQRLGNMELASTLLTAAVRPETRWQNNYLLLLQEAAELELQAGDTALAGELIARQLDEEEMPTARAWAIRAEVEFAAKNYEHAVRYWSRAELLLPDSIDQIKMAAAAESLGDVSSAQRHMALAEQFAGINMFRHNDLANAIVRLRQAAAIESDLPETWLYLGESERQTGNGAQAEAAYRRCLQLDPAQGRAREGLRRLGKVP